MEGKSSKIEGMSSAVRVVIISLDDHLVSSIKRTEEKLRKEIPNLTIGYHAAADWARYPETLQACKEDIAQADFIIVTMLFLDDQVQAILPALQARRDSCDAIIGCMSASEIVKLTRVGRFEMNKPASGAISFLKRLRGTKDKTSSAGASQMKLLRRLPKVLKFVPGTAQDVRSYFLTMQYWLAGSDENIISMIAYLVDRYAAGPREELRGRLTVEPPVDYPDVGAYHPRLVDKVTDDYSKLPLARSKKPAVGLLLMRSYILSGDTAHYDGVIAALEARGLRVIPVYSSGLDARPAIEKFFIKNGVPVIDAMVSLTGFSLVGGPAYNDPKAAATILEKLNVPYLSAHALEFQTLNEWGNGTNGLSPVEATLMVAIPELDGTINPAVFGGRSNASEEGCDGCYRQCRFPANDNGKEKRMMACPERTDSLASRIEEMVRLRRTERAERKVAFVLFNFPPNSGATGSAAHLSVFESLFNTLSAMGNEGYTIDIPKDAETLKNMLLEGNSAQYGTDTNVHALVSTDEHIERERRLNDIEAQWGPAPGKHQTDGKSIQILGRQFGNIFVGIQPAFGYEGDPMRLLFEQGFTPTHAFSAFYSYLRQDFEANAVVHFGTHGALEFMPGKQTALSGDCWPDYLIGSLPNIYFYAANNPSEAAIAKRRSNATTISYLTPSVTKAELYKELSDLKSTIDRWRATEPTDDSRETIAELIHAQAVNLDLATPEQDWSNSSEIHVDALRQKLSDYEETLIPQGLHVAGNVPDINHRREMIIAHDMPNYTDNDDFEVFSKPIIDAILVGDSPTHIAHKFKCQNRLEHLQKLSKLNNDLQVTAEIPAIIQALDGQFIAPVAGGDIINNPDIVPTGRNIHGFDPFKMPSAYAVNDGMAQAERLLAKHMDAGQPLPETVAIVLWGTDNLKSEGAQLSQALALMGAEPRFDGFGRLAGAKLIDLEKLDRPRIDVVATLSGIFRDLLPMQTGMLAKAALLAAQADEPVNQNFIRKHALAYQAQHDCSLETAALRVFSNADGAYGANVNQLIDAGCWEDEDELADAYATRKCFAYGTSGAPESQKALLNSILKDVDLAYQNLESIELGITTVDHYFDTLGGIGRAVKKAKGSDTPVYISDQTRGAGSVRTLSDQVALEARTRTLNPKWFEGMLKHGYEGVRQIEAQITNTVGWSATTGQVAPWVYEKITETFVLDTDLRDRLAQLNPKSCSRVADRLLEAYDRNYWSPDDETLETLRRAAEDLEDRVEGVVPSGAAA